MDNNEDKHDRFIRIATKRTNDILDRLRILGNCSNKSVYEYTNEEVAKIFGEIEKQTRLTKARFMVGRRNTFELKLSERK